MYRSILALTLIASTLVVAFGGKGVSAYAFNIPICSTNLPTKANIDTMFAHTSTANNSSDSWVLYRNASNEYQLVLSQDSNNRLWASSDALMAQGSANYKHLYNPDFSLSYQWHSGNTFYSDFNDGSCVVMGDNWNEQGIQNYSAVPNYAEYEGSTPPPNDICSNIEGTQETMPTGKEDPESDGVCTDIVVTPPPEPEPEPTGEITFVQKISAVFAFGIGVLIAKQFTFRLYD